MKLGEGEREEAGDANSDRAKEHFVHVALCLYVRTHRCVMFLFGCICLFVRSFVRSLVCLAVWLFVCLFVRSIVCLFVCLWSVGLWSVGSVVGGCSRVLALLKCFLSIYLFAR